MSQNVAGPYCTQLLGDFGADVIKIERPRTGDDTRGWRPPQWGDISTTFLSINRNKKSICVDIAQKRGQEIIRRLVEKADVFLHTLKPSSAEEYRLTFQELSAINKTLIYCDISAFGNVGPLKSLPGYDPLIQAYSGIMSVTGHPDQEPVRAGVSLIDYTTGIWAFIGILAGLFKRNREGSGAQVSASLLETGVAWVNSALMTYMATGKTPRKYGSGHPSIAPYEAFRTSDGFVIIAAGNDALFSKLTDAIGVPDLSKNELFLTNSHRLANRSRLHVLIEDRTKKMSTKGIIELLRKSEVPCSSINTIDAVCSDEQVKALGMISELPNEIIPDFRVVDLPLRIDGKRGSLRSRPPKLGEHSDEVLRSIYSDSEIASLKAEGIVQ